MEGRYPDVNVTTPDSETSREIPKPKHPGLKVQIDQAASMGGKLWNLFAQKKNDDQNSNVEADMQQP